MQTEPHDTLRLGLSALKDDAAVSHPVESIQNNVRHYPCSPPRPLWRSTFLHVGLRILQGVEHPRPAPRPKPGLQGTGPFPPKSTEGPHGSHGNQGDEQ